MATLTPEYVYDLLTGSTPSARLRGCMRRLPGNDSLRRSAAILTAIAGWESNGYNSDAVGDGGDSLGLWQINVPTWASELGGPTRARELAGGDDAQQLQAMTPAWCGAVSRMRFARGRGWPLQGPLAAVHASIIWQYGGPEYARWVAAVPPASNPAASFRQFRANADRPVLGEYTQRQNAIVSTYLELMGEAPALPDKGPLETAGDFWWEQLTEKGPKVPGGGNWLGWAVLALGAWLGFKWLSR